MNLRTVFSIFFISFIVILTTPATFAGEILEQHSAVIHAHTTVSGGDCTPEELVRQARESGIRILIITDTQRRVIEYGIWPLRKIICRSEIRPSAQTYGAEKYLAEIDRLQSVNPDMAILSGMEVAPYYYVDKPEGDLLAFRDYSRHMLVLGLSGAEDYDSLPTIHGPASVRFIWLHATAFLGVLALFAAAVFAAFKVKRKPLKIAAIAAAAVFALGIYNNHPFGNTRYDQYCGYQGAAPYQDVIDAAAEKGGLVLWAHPEAYEPASPKKIGPASFITAPYPEMLRETDGYAAFAGLYGDRIGFTKPGGTWDGALVDYCRGARKTPPFIFAERDFSRKGERFDSYRTVFLLPSLSRREALEALAEGRMYALHAPSGADATLEFEARDSAGPGRACMGRTLAAKSAEVRVRAAFTIAVEYELVLIRDGAVEARVPGMGTNLDYLRKIFPEKGKTSYMRAEVRAGEFAILSNPIFFKGD